MRNEKVLEVAILNIQKGEERSFEEAFLKAQKIISSMPGYISLNWTNALEDHTAGFRESENYQ